MKLQNCVCVPASELHNNLISLLLSFTGIGLSCSGAIVDIEDIVIRDYVVNNDDDRFTVLKKHTKQCYEEIFSRIVLPT